MRGPEYCGSRDCILRGALEIDADGAVTAPFDSIRRLGVLDVVVVLWPPVLLAPSCPRHIPHSPQAVRKNHARRSGEEWVDGVAVEDRRPRHLSKRRLWPFLDCKPHVE